ncbi:hypothetical protein AVEN_219784-1 [Araneus ventricosus]|uniref:Uncharacterized protein n=1 Tax=Araneus ventricosus TaxID=182803 RepID=A0A4Y2JZ17_ARAVE|nr:hypothetical protein AVEN_219784-1 [Araneus ventricosus]
MDIPEPVIKIINRYQAVGTGTMGPITNHKRVILNTSYRGRYLSARYANARYFSSNPPKGCYDAIPQLTKGASLAKGWLNFPGSKTPVIKVQNSIVEVLTFNLHPFFSVFTSSTLTSNPQRSGRNIQSQLFVRVSNTSSNRNIRFPSSVIIGSGQNVVASFGSSTCAVYKPIGTVPPNPRVYT